MSKPFIKIVNEQLTLVGSIPKGNPRVISILGKARMGKSTFLNTIVTYMTGESQAPFKAMDCDDHCTRGIDGYHLPEHNLFLLDSQGLDYEDASHDPHLLLFLYIVSDLIIFNDTRRLENGALKLMESVCTFTNYLDIETVMKPKLYFRIFDSDVKDPAKNLEKVLGTYNDQYQSIRKSIKHLFDKDLRLLTTEPLGRPAKMMLEHNMYKQLLAEPLGFKEAVETILTAAHSAKAKSILTKVPEVLSNINNNKEISIQKLDVVTLQAENDIHKWIQETVPAAMYSDISVDGTQNTFANAVEPRIDSMKGVLSAFQKRFKDVEESIREPFFRNLKEKLDTPIQNAIVNSKVKAQEIVKAQLVDAHRCREYPQVNSCNNSFSTIPPHYWKNYLAPLNTLETAMAHIYEPVKMEIADWIQNARITVEEEVNFICQEEETQRADVRKFSAKLLANMEKWMLQYIDRMITAKTILETNTQLLNKVRDAYLFEFEETMNPMVSRRKLHFKMNQDGDLEAFSEVIHAQMNAKDYDLVKPDYTIFVDKVTTYVSNPSTKLREAIVEQKEQFLYGKVFKSLVPIKGELDSIKGWVIDPVSDALIKANPEIQFVEDVILKKHLSPQDKYNNLMTIRTFNVTYTKLYQRTLVDLVSKELCTKEYGSKILHTEEGQAGKASILNFYKATKRYDELIEEHFVKRVKKNYCKMIVEEFAFPEDATFDQEHPKAEDKAQQLHKSRVQKVHFGRPHHRT
jgi:hypothetical protein